MQIAVLSPALLCRSENKSAKLATILPNCPVFSLDAKGCLLYVYCRER